MKKNIQLIIAFFTVLTLGSCAKDNFEEPESDFSGRFVYEGEPLQFRHNAFKAELWQRGFGNFGVINVNINQEGLFAARMFDGDYKFTVSNGQVPFLWPKNAAGAPDSLSISLSGDQTRDIEVQPYYMIRTPQITIAGGQVSASCAIEKIITDANGRNLERVSLYLNKTQFVDDSDDRRLASTDAENIGNLSNITMSLAVPNISPSQNYVFARIGLKMAGIENMIFSPVVKLNM